MKTLKIIVGSIGVLTALFAGGCGLFYFGIEIMALIDGRGGYPIIVGALMVGIVPGIIGGAVAWWAFK